MRRGRRPKIEEEQIDAVIRRYETDIAIVHRRGYADGGVVMLFPRPVVLWAFQETCVSRDAHVVVRCADVGHLALRRGEGVLRGPEAADADRGMM